MPEITIQGTPVEFPDTAAAPEWSEAVIQFAQLVETALATIIGAFDVAPQSIVIDAYNPGTDVDIPNLSFPTSTVRAAFIRYATFRETDSTTAYEAGELTIVYNPDGPTDNKWEVGQRLQGNGSVTFSVTDTGQVRFSTSAIAGASHEGTLVYVAQAILQV